VINKVVARYADGRIVKGSTTDFVPAKAIFHLAPSDAPRGAKPVAVEVKDLKAVFFVKDFEGRKDYQPSQEFNPAKPVQGRKIRVVFQDQEVLVGATQGYQPGRPGFFMTPADGDSNIERCYVVTASAKEVTLL
jgi:hypothetical protein